MAKFQSTSDASLPLPSQQSLPREKTKPVPPSFLKNGRGRGKRGGGKKEGRARAQARAMSAMSDTDKDEM